MCEFLFYNIIFRGRSACRALFHCIPRFCGVGVYVLIALFSLDLRYLLVRRLLDSIADLVGLVFLPFALYFPVWILCADGLAVFC